MIGKGKANAGPKGTIAFSTPETQSGAMTFLRSISSFAVVIGGLAIFLILASLLLVSNTIGFSFQDYFLGVKRVSRPQSPILASLDDSHTKDIVSMPTSFQEGHQHLSFKDDNTTIWSSKHGTSPFSNNGEAIGKPGDASILPEIAVNNSNVVLGEGMNLNLRDSPPPFSSLGKVTNDSGSFEVANNGPATSFGSGNYDGNFTTSEVSVGHHLPNISSIGGLKNCDLYHGKWVYDSEGPLYTNNSCPIITQMQNCQGNGRLDKEYENWRWKPERCMLPRFDGKKFLELMRGKTLAFVGDSVARNQMESLICILWQVEVPKNRGNKRMHRWYFRSTSTMITRIWSSWLVHKTSEPMEFAPEGIVKVHLDLPDKEFMEFLPEFDVVVLSSGHWFAKQSVYVLNRTIVGGQLWRPPPGATLDMRINNIEAFGLSVETALAAIVANPKFKGLAIVRSYSPDHYEGGAWNTGGSCTGKVSPASYVVRNGFTDVMHEKQVTGFKHAVQKSGNKSNLIFMDVTEVFGYRPDGHPGPYRNPDPNKKTKRGPNGEPPPQDCLHWCMPGPVDTWNEFLLEIIWRYFRDFEKYVAPFSTYG